MCRCLLPDTVTEHWLLVDGLLITFVKRGCHSPFWP